MGLRAQLKARVASCATKQTQLATFEDSDATGAATEAQQNPATPHEIRVSGATDNATTAQLVPKDCATLPQKEPELRVAFTRARNSQLFSLTAERITRQVIEAAMRRCDEFNDNDQARQQMRDDCLSLSPAMQADLLAHFLETTRPSTDSEIVRIDL